MSNAKKIAPDRLCTAGQYGTLTSMSITDNLSFIGEHGPHRSKGVLADLAPAAEAAGFRLHVAASGRPYLINPDDGYPFPVLCAEIIDADGGRCGDHAEGFGALCADHVEEYRSDGLGSYSDDELRESVYRGREMFV